MSFYTVTDKCYVRICKMQKHPQVLLGLSQKLEREVENMLIHETRQGFTYKDVNNVEFT